MEAVERKGTNMALKCYRDRFTYSRVDASEAAGNKLRIRSGKHDRNEPQSGITRIEIRPREQSLHLPNYQLCHYFSPC